MIFFVNEAMGIGNSGVEHAEFYRAKLLRRLNRSFKFLFTSLIEEQHEAMDKWHLSEDEVINMWEFFTFGDAYAKKGITERYDKTTQTLIDRTNTTRMTTSTTISGLRIVKYMIKQPNPDEPGMLLVSTIRVEIFSLATNKKMVAYEMLNVHKETQVRNIHLFHQGNRDSHLFFPNEVLLRRHFFSEMLRLFSDKSTFILDRGEKSEAALMDGNIGNAKLVGVVHADHLSNRDEPDDPLWNNYYEYELSHLNRLQALVVATQLQKQDLLIDFPYSGNKIWRIPVGGVPDDIEFVHQKEFGKPLRLITMSRLASEKHIDLVVKAVVKLHNKGQAVTLDIYGGGGEKAKLQKIITAEKAQDYVFLKGPTTQPQEAYKNHDAFVSASYSEGFGLTYIEALSAGLPVVTFKARYGALELFANEKTGFLQDFKTDDEAFNIDQLVIGIERLQKADLAKLQENIVDSLNDFKDSHIATQWGRLLDEI